MTGQRTRSMMASVLAVSITAACGAPSVVDAGDAAANIDGGSALDGTADTGARMVTFTPPPHSRITEPGIRREVFSIAGATAAANPTSMASTSPENNRVQVIRYRRDTVPVTPVRGVVVCLPGFLSGAGPFDSLARSIVRRSIAAMEPLEVWAIDRRANLLEDLRGMDAADVLRDPEVARGYYLDRNVTLNGETFRGFRSSRDRTLGFMSEWGLAVTLGDVRAVLALVPNGRDHVVLAGHSLGGTLVEAFAAWDFDTVPGAAGLAGLVLIDGMANASNTTEAQYLTDGTGGAPFGSPGLATIRSAGPYYVEIPTLGPRAFAIAEIVARRAALAPDAVVMDPFRDQTFGVLLGGVQLPPMTNAAAFGFGFDDASSAISIAAMSMGRPVGPTTLRPGLLGMGSMIAVPSDPTVTYRWTDATMTVPREFTPVIDAANSFAATPTNFIEWYFPTRLALDVSALGDLRLASTAWQFREGIRAMHAGEIDAPVLAIGAGNGIIRTVATFDAVRARLTLSVGPGRPNAGALRTADAGFRAIVVPGMTHVDPLSSSDDNPANPVPEAIATFARSNTTGTVTIAVMP